jgi:hypothetical protein
MHGFGVVLATGWAAVRIRFEPSNRLARPALCRREDYSRRCYLPRHPPRTIPRMDFLPRSARGLIESAAFPRENAALTSRWSTRAADPSDRFMFIARSFGTLAELYASSAKVTRR